MSCGGGIFSAAAFSDDDIGMTSLVGDVEPIVGEANASVAPPDYTVLKPDAEAPPILTPSLKEQTITKLRLANGMGVFIKSDPGLETSAMAVGVEVGSWQDPDEALGMAHFVEHMMFMGTKQHPKPGQMKLLEYI